MNAGSIASLTSRSELVALAYRLAQRPQGASVAEIFAAADSIKTTHNNVSSTLAWMARTERVTLTKVDEGRTKSRYFATSEPLAEVERRMQAKHRASLSQSAGTKKGTKRPDSAKRMAKKKPVPLVIAKAPKAPPASSFATAEPIYPPGFEKQVIPHGQDYRYSVSLPRGGGVITQDWRERRLVAA